MHKEKGAGKSYRSWFGCAGKRNTQDKPIAKGIWRGTDQLKRGELVLINVGWVFLLE